MSHLTRKSHTVVCPFSFVYPNQKLSKYENHPYFTASETNRSLKLFGNSDKEVCFGAKYNKYKAMQHFKSSQIIEQISS